MTENTVYREFNDRADKFVRRLLDGYTPDRYRDVKVIHDPVWGTMKFYPWELTLLDSPLLQRLRNINQLGLAVYTYPSAHHSRFEHTLGVTNLVTRMVDSINDSSPSADEGFRIISREDLYMLRIAAILHDVGHCFFSHLSERMYGTTPEFEALKNSSEELSKAQPHEILGCIIVNTPSFKKFFKDHVDLPFAPADGMFFENIGRMIVGAPIKGITEQDGRHIKKYYLTEMINGQFDADSLDYLRRDSYITGLSLTYHIDRFLYKIKIVDRNEQCGGETVTGRHLTVSMSGVSTVEEMIFGKQMLTRYIYQHQKVLAADALVYDVVNGLRANGKLRHPCDFLYFCDDDIYKIYDESGDPDFAAAVAGFKIHADSKKTISDVVKQIKTRSLPKKALVINMSNIKSINGREPTLALAYEFLCGVAESGGLRSEIRDTSLEICKTAGLDANDIDLFDIFYSFPKPTTAKNYTDVFVAMPDGKFVELSRVADLNDWAAEFSGRAWNAYVFSAGHMLPVVSIAARDALRKRGMEFKDDRIFSNLKHFKQIEDLQKRLGRR